MLFYVVVVADNMYIVKAKDTKSNHTHTYTNI